VLLYAESSVLPPVELAEAESSPPVGASALPAPADEPSLVDEPSTRPEPVVLRASQRPAAPLSQSFRTPCVGSWLEVASREEARYFVPDLVLEDRDATERMPEIEEVEEPLEASATVTPIPVVESACVEDYSGQIAEVAYAADDVEGSERFVAWESSAPLPAQTAVLDALSDQDSTGDHERNFRGEPELEDAVYADEGVEHGAASVALLAPLTMTEPGLGPVEERGRTETGLAPPPESEASAPRCYEPRFLPRRSDVEALLRGFLAAESKSEIDLCRELTEIAGVEQLEPAPALNSR
jgi:hypothetical protein